MMLVDKGQGFNAVRLVELDNTTRDSLARMGLTRMTVTLLESADGFQVRLGFACYGGNDPILPAIFVKE